MFLDAHFLLRLLIPIILEFKIIWLQNTVYAIFYCYYSNVQQFYNNQLYFRPIFELHIILCNYPFMISLFGLNLFTYSNKPIEATLYSIIIYLSYYYSFITTCFKCLSLVHCGNIYSWWNVLKSGSQECIHTYTYSEISIRFVCSVNRDTLRKN